MSGNESSALTRWITRKLRALVIRTERRDHDEEAPERSGLVISLCLLASTLLWFSFSMRETYTRTLEIPTAVTNLAPDEALAGLPPDRVRVQVDGEGIQLLRLYYNPPTIPVDARSLPVDLGAVTPEILSNVRLESVTPRTILLQKEPRLTRTIPILPRLSVATDPGHHVVGGLQLSPDSVTISGARSIVRGINAWPTERRSLPTIGDSLIADVVLLDSLTGLVDRGADRIRVSASVKEFTEGIRRVPVRVTGEPPGQRVTLEPPSVQVIYQVPLQQFDAALQAQDFYATVSYEAVRTDTTGSLRPEVQLPEGIVFREVRTEPAALRYYYYVLDE